MLECTRQAVHSLNVQILEFNGTEEIKDREAAYVDFLGIMKSKIAYILIKNVSLPDNSFLRNFRNVENILTQK